MNLTDNFSSFFNNTSPSIPSNLAYLLPLLRASQNSNSSIPVPQADSSFLLKAPQPNLATQTQDYLQKKVKTGLDIDVALQNKLNSEPSFLSLFEQASLQTQKLQGPSPALMPSIRALVAQKLLLAQLGKPQDPLKTLLQFSSFGNLLNSQGIQSQQISQSQEDLRNYVGSYLKINQPSQPTTIIQKPVGHSTMVSSSNLSPSSQDNKTVQVKFFREAEEVSKPKPKEKMKKKGSCKSHRL